ncbi:efflux RND transporter permease subunit [Roseobacter sp. YSTF-M11]|uniref:Efflux RND transporter permease subunit n=1 Tax=Roseobacter insulae TaxID=2859783 RepID=A0A9X1G081_9RHOB|nr:efflux RND transporter permease subunit [Roseobacter insulae]MBW4710838.1 efflux RND transporter permease subunit [Roseobacter insulae]
MLTRLVFNPRILALSLLFLAAVGLGAIQTVPRSEDPTIKARIAGITTVYPGASATRVEAFVTQVIEDELRTLAEIEELSSTSRVGVSIVQVTLADQITEVEPIWSLVRDRLADIRSLLPAGTTAPDLNEDGGYAYTVAYAVSASDGRDVDRLILQRYAEALSDVLRAAPGTEYVAQHGSSPEVVEVIIDEMALQAAGQDVQSVASALSSADARNSAGTLSNEVTSLTVELSNTLDSLDRLRQIPISRDGAGALVLGDIATIQRTVAQPPVATALYNGDLAVLVGTRMEPGLRVDLWVPTVLEAVEVFTDRRVEGIDIDLVFEQQSYTEDRLLSVVTSLIQGLMIVVAILFFTMGIRSALAVGLAIPMTALLTAAMFPLAGISFHQMSIIGIVVALGLMVDNAIIMTNDIREDLAQGSDHGVAVSKAYKKLFFPLMASTVTTMLAFSPIALLPGPAGEFVGPLSVAVLCALFSSFVISMYVIPAISPHLFKSGTAGRGFLANGISSKVLSVPFRAFVGFFVRRPIVGLTFCGAPAVLGILSLSTVPTEFFPAMDRDQFRIEVMMPQSTIITRTQEVAERIEAELLQTEGVTQTLVSIGAASPQLYFNTISSESANPAFADFIVNTDGHERTDELIPHLQDRLSMMFPEARVIVIGYGFGPPGATPIELQMFGPDMEVLEEYGQIAAGILANVPEVVGADVSLHRDAVQVQVTVNDETARLVGLDASTIAGQLNAALSGQTGGFVVEASEQLPISVRFAKSARSRIADINDFALFVPGTQTPAGIPLTGLADINLVPAWVDIDRLDGERIQTVSSNVTYQTIAAPVQADFERALEEAGFEMPPGYRYAFGGAQEQRSDAVARLMSQVVTLVLLALTILVLAFNSFRRMGVVLITGILTAGFAFLVLKLTGFAFGFIIIIGVMGLIGVGLNMSIVMIAALDEDDGARSGKVDRIIDVVCGPTARHIWSTTITTAGGFIPLMLIGGDFWPPFAYVFAGGLLLLTIVAYIYTPCMYRLLLVRRAEHDIVPAQTAVKA